MSIKDLTTNLVEYQWKQSINRSIVVGIDGLGGSGKTSLAKELSRDLNVKNIDMVIIHIDDYIVERNKRYQTGHPEWYEYYHLQWDTEMLRNELFQELHTNCSELTLPLYDKQNDSISIKDITVNPQSVILIEGIFLQRKEWRKYLDFVIYLDCPRELRMERVLKRDSYIGDYQARLNKYKKRYWIAEEHYLNIENPHKGADIILNDIKLTKVLSELCTRI